MRLDGDPDLLLRLVEPLSLLRRNRTDATLRAAKGRAVLALLGAAPALRRSRAWIQAKLWSDRPPEQGPPGLRSRLVGQRCKVSHQRVERAHDGAGRTRTRDCFPSTPGDRMEIPTRLCRTSRWLNRLLGGKDEMVCARAHRERWRIVPVIDAVFFALRAERQHCRLSAEHERRSKAKQFRARHKRPRRE
jgi:hypothetical protein